SQPTWIVQLELGDGACGFRAIARRFLGRWHLQRLNSDDIFGGHCPQYFSSQVSDQPRV
ncbi:unnamed protein product, partial [Ascophyllum nodosum]